MTVLLKTAMGLGVALLLSPLEVAGAGEALSPRATVGAYYFDGWAGTNAQAGKADWARNAPTHLTKRMLDEFPDREPLWCWRDDTAEVMERQIDLAADHGIAYFAFCWYWHKSEKEIREDPKHTGLELFLKAKNNARMRFCLLVANHAGFEIQGTEEWKKAADVWMPYLSHPRHLRVGGKPLLILFAPGNRDKAGFEYLQESARKAGLPGVAVAGCGNGPADLFSLSTRYNVVPGWEKGLEKHPYAELLDAHRKSWAGTREQPHIPCLTAGWDRRPWEEGPNPKCCWYHPDRTPEQFGACVKDAVVWMEANPEKATPEKLMLIYAWNEFGEGGYLAPTKGDPGGAYLKAVKEVVLPDGAKR
jgi:hypothetical protein